VLTQLGIRTVVNLLDQFPDAYKAFLDAQDVRYVHCPVRGNKVTPEDMSRTAANQVLKVLNTPALHPVLLHCRSGKHRTGAIVGCLRCLQGHSATFAAAEYVKFASPKERAVDIVFIESFEPAKVAR
jgi:tyrosine-protein phosphatase SIW14